MAELGIMLAWIISMVSIAVFATLFAFSTVLLRVSKIAEVKFFVLAAFSLLLSSLFELVSAAGYLSSIFEIVEKDFAVLLSKGFLFLAGFFFILFFYHVRKNIKKYT